VRTAVLACCVLVLAACGSSSRVSTPDTTRCQGGDVACRIAVSTHNYEAAGASHRDAACLAEALARVNAPHGSSLILVSPDAEAAVDRCHVKQRDLDKIGAWVRSHFPIPTVRRTVPPTTTRAVAKHQESFVGHWQVHGGTLDIRSNGSAIEDFNCGGQVCDEMLRLALVRSPNGRRLIATIKSISYTNEHGRRIANPDPAESESVGDVFSLEFVAPQLMKTTLMTSNRSLRRGNPYWCGADLAASLQHFCGA
jgi:hypothetical protein